MRNSDKWGNPGYPDRKQSEPYFHGGESHGRYCSHNLQSGYSHLRRWSAWLPARTDRRRYRPREVADTSEEASGKYTGIPSLSLAAGRNGYTENSWSRDSSNGERTISLTELQEPPQHLPQCGVEEVQVPEALLFSKEQLPEEQLLPEVQLLQDIKNLSYIKIWR